MAFDGPEHKISCGNRHPRGHKRHYIHSLCHIPYLITCLDLDLTLARVNDRWDGPLS